MAEEDWCCSGSLGTWLWVGGSGCRFSVAAGQGVRSQRLAVKLLSKRGGKEIFQICIKPGVGQVQPCPYLNVTPPPRFGDTFVLCPLESSYDSILTRKGFEHRGHSAAPASVFRSSSPPCHQGGEISLDPQEGTGLKSGAWALQRSPL